LDAVGVRRCSTFSGDLELSIVPPRKPSFGVALPGFTAAVVTPQGGLITAGAEPTVDFWKLESRAQTDNIAVKNSVMTLELSRNGEQLLVTTLDGGIQTISTATPHIANTCNSRDPILSARWRPSLHPNLASSAAAGNGPGQSQQIRGFPSGSLKGLQRVERDYFRLQPSDERNRESNRRP